MLEKKIHLLVVLVLCVNYPILGDIPFPVSALLNEAPHGCALSENRLLASAASLSGYKSP